jgi:hypothetical protein
MGWQTKSGAKGQADSLGEFWLQQNSITRALPLNASELSDTRAEYATANRHENMFSFTSGGIITKLGSTRYESASHP